MSISADRHAEIFGKRTRGQTGSYVLRDGKLVPAWTVERGPRKSDGIQVQRDHAAIVSPVDRSVIDGRRDRREHMARHALREVDPSERRPTYHNPRFAAKHGLPYTPEQRWKPQVAADVAAFRNQDAALKRVREDR